MLVVSRIISVISKNLHHQYILRIIPATISWDGTWETVEISHIITKKKNFILIRARNKIIVHFIPIKKPKILKKIQKDVLQKFLVLLYCLDFQCDAHLWGFMMFLYHSLPGRPGWDKRWDYEPLSPLWLLITRFTGPSRYFSFDRLANYRHKNQNEKDK